MKLYYKAAFVRYNSSHFLGLSWLESKNNMFCFILLQFGTLLQNDS